MSDLPYSTITVRGPDAFDFLQAQLAADVRVLAEMGAQPTARDGEDSVPPANLFAWCNPKGRVICLFRARQVDDDYTLSLPGDLVDTVIERLAMFRFRSKVEFECGEADAERLGITTTFDDWRLRNLRNGIVEITAAQTEKWTPHMLNLDLLGAVSVDKGCYPGQEIVSRTHYRGKTRRRLLRFTSAAPLAPGDKVSDGERDVGEVVNAIGAELLAVVPLDEQDQQLTVRDIKLVKCPLPYLKLE